MVCGPCGTAGRKYVSKDIAARAAAGQQIVRQAGDLALKYFNARNELVVEHKGLQDVVSLADREVEELIRAGIEDAFPGDGVLGEELGMSDAADPKDGLWVADPIDGTSCFLAGLPSWCVSLAYIVDGTVEIGLIYVPCNDEIYVSQRGLGATLNGTALTISPATSFRDGAMGIGFSHRCKKEEALMVIEPLLAGGGMYYNNNSGALMLAYVAAGRLIGYYEPHINAWDCLAGIGLIQEAGGWANDFLAGDGLAKGNPLLGTAPGVTEECRRITGV